MVAVSHYKSETVFDYSWKEVIQAFWFRYPNPSSTHVLTEDTVMREVRDGKLFSRRILSKTNSVPKWGERFYKNVPVKIIEDSVLDLKTKKLITFTRNIGMKKIMKVDEIVEYTEQADGRTLAVRQAYISSQVFGFSRAIRAFAIERFKSNGHKAANGFNYVLQHMFPNHRHVDSMLSTTTSTTASHQQQQHLQHQHSAQISSVEHPITTIAIASSSSSTKEVLKKKANASYMFLKNQIIKLVQMFSVKN